MGNIAAGHLAKICGLPIARFVGSVNINDITHRVFSKGEFHIEEEMFKNLSEAINIQAPYNFERVLYWSSGIDFCYQQPSSIYFQGNDSKLVKQMYLEFEKTGKMTITGDLFRKLQDLCLTYR